MVLKILITILVIDILLALILLSSDRPRREKAVWSTILLAIPLAGLAIYHLMRKKDTTASLKDWESK
jgi:hypothetical protein